MANFSRQYLFRIIGASLGAFLHLFVVATVVFAGGEGPAFTLLYMDFPIVYLWQFFIGPAGAGGGPLLFLCFLGGTLMHTFSGWVIGGLGDWLLRKLNK